MNLKGIGKKQKDLITILQCHPDRFVVCTWSKYGSKTGNPKCEVVVSDEDGNDYETVTEATLNSCIERGILVQSGFKQPAVSIEITTYKLNTQ